MAELLSDFELDFFPVEARLADPYSRGPSLTITRMMAMVRIWWQRDVGPATECAFKWL